jgi:hypothetical protein
MSSDLANGSKTVKADGGNMIAVKGSEFSRSTGDEPGTAGGVKSSTNMKESKWLTYSFDVKIEGKNACRLSDKKTQNHANTVDAMGTVHAPVSVSPSNLLPLDCAGFSGPKVGPLTECEKKQICAKCEEINRDPKKIKRRTGANMKAARKAGNIAAKAFREVFTIIVRDGVYDKEFMLDHFAHPCAYEEWKAAGSDPTFKNPPFSPDHIHEIQLGGSAASSINLKWTSKNANEYLGRELKNYDPSKHDGVAPNCCEG